MMYAAAMGREESVRRLLTHPAIEVNLTSAMGNTAIQLATECGQEAIVRLLLGVPDIDVGSDGGASLLAAMAGGHESIVRLLRDHQLQRQARAIVHPSLCDGLAGLGGVELEEVGDNVSDDSSSTSSEVFTDAEDWLDVSNVDTTQTTM